MDTEAKKMRFDIVLSFDIDRNEALETVCSEVREVYPDYEINVVPDVDTSD